MDAGSWVVMTLLLIGSLVACRALVILFKTGDTRWRPSDKVGNGDIARTALEK